MSAKSIDRVYGKYTSCLLLNPTNVPIHLKKDKVVGDIMSLDSEFQIEPLENSTLHVGNMNITKDKSKVDKTADLDIDLQNSDLTDEQKQKLLAFIKDNRKVFA